MSLDSVLFDFGNTLVSTRLDWPRVVPRSLASLRQDLEDEFSGLDAERLGRDLLFLRAQAKERARLHWIETPARDSLAAALALQHVARPSQERLEQAVAAFFAPEEEAFPLIEGMPELLERLRSMGLKLGLLSNATSAGLIRRCLARHRLLDLFDSLIVSEEQGICKPDPALFRLSLQKLSSRAERSVMVGDLPETDVAGAKQTGMRAILVDLLNSNTLIPQAGLRPDALAKSPQQVLAMLEAWHLELL